MNPVNAAGGMIEIEKQVQANCVFFLLEGAEDPFETSISYKANVPSQVASEEEFYLTNLAVTFTLPERFVSTMSSWNTTQIQPITTSLKINSENESQTIDAVNGLLFNPEVDFPKSGNFSFTVASVENVGFFTSGQEGDVILKADEIKMTIEQNSPTIPVSAKIHCTPSTDQDNTIANILIDNETPIITLNGDNPMIVKQGDSYEEPGATAQDNFDGDVSDDIEISGEVDTNTIGTYTVTYTVSDSVGNESTVERTVNVVEPFGSWYTGEGPPNDSLGTNGDSYLDITTGDVYKRDPNTWTKVSNLKGDDGKQGSAILTGSGAPSADAGDVGDLYLDTNTGDVYEKTADGWKKIANLQGPAGPPGPQGPKGSDGSSGGSSSNNDGSGKGKTKTSTGSDTDGKGKSAQGGKLPKTATSLPTLILIGALLATAGGVLFLKRRNKTA